MKQLVEQTLWGEDQVFCFGNVNFKMCTRHPSRNEKAEVCT